MPKSNDDARQPGRPPQPLVKNLANTNQKPKTTNLQSQVRDGRSPWSR